MTTVAIIQARMGSSRLPGKVLRPLLGKPMLAHIVDRVRAACGIDKVIVATSDKRIDQTIVDFCVNEQIDCYAGDEIDVLDRFYHAAAAQQAERVLRITADCPLADPGLIAQLIEFFAAGELDYAAVATGAGAVFMNGGRYPDGYDAECMRMSALKRAWEESSMATDREHVTPYLWRQPEVFTQAKLESEQDYSSLRLTVDNEEDFELIRKIYEALYSTERHFLLADVIRFLGEHPDTLLLNQQHIGHEGYEALWQRSAA
jgi:spore coat polysaccharide biosynthesis protein SpsF